MEYDDCQVNTGYSEPELIQILENNGFDTEIQNGILHVHVKQADWKGNDSSEWFNAINFFVNNKCHLSI